MTPYYDEDGITIYHGDCREVLPWLESGFVVITDPPFNVRKDYGTSHDNLGPSEYFEMLGEVADLAEVQAWVTPTKELLAFAEILGTEARPVVVRRGAHGPQRWGWYDQFDLILVRGRPLRPTSNLWEDIRLKGEGYFFREHSFNHPGYTPQPIFNRLISVLTQPLDEVVDPFAGTGTSLVAAKAQGRRAIGIEIEERYCEIAVQRLAQGVLNFAHQVGEPG